MLWPQSAEYIYMNIPEAYVERGLGCNHYSLLKETICPIGIFHYSFSAGLGLELNFISTFA